MYGLMKGGANVVIETCKETAVSLMAEAAVKVCTGTGRVRVVNDVTGKSYTGKVGDIITVLPGLYNIFVPGLNPIPNVRVGKGVKAVGCE